MPICFVPLCNCRDTYKRCKFFRFPSDEKTKTSWIKQIRRQDKLPKTHDRVCSCHFVDQKRNNLPTIFPWKKAISPTKRCKRLEYRTKRLAGQTENVTPTTSEGCKSSIFRPEENNTTIASEEFESSTLHSQCTRNENVSPTISEGCESSIFRPEENNSTIASEEFESSTLHSQCTRNENTTPIASEECESSTLRPQENNTPTASEERESSTLRPQCTRNENTTQIASQECESSISCSQCTRNAENGPQSQGFGVHLLNSDKSDKLMLHFTGVPAECFKIIVELCKTVKFKYVLGYQPSSISFENQMLLTLMKMRLNLTNIDLGMRFGISESGVSNVFRTLLLVLHRCLYQKLMTAIPSQSKNELSLPSAFSLFRNCRAVFDCTEFPCEKPSSMDKQKIMYSNYKHTHTVKVLVVVAPNGVITRVSDAYPGSSSDKCIVQHSNILKEFQPGDLILADKGFLLKDIVPDGVSVNIPPFLCTPQFTPKEVEETRNIAKARIHVERAIGRLKRFRILHFIPVKTLPIATMLIQVCAALTNFRNPLIKEVGQLYSATCNQQCEANDVDEIPEHEL